MMRIRKLAFAAFLGFTLAGIGPVSAANTDKLPSSELVGAPVSLVYAAKIDGPNNHIAFTIMLEVAGKRVPAIFEGEPQHPVLDALAAIQAEIDDGDDETITLTVGLLGSISNATYPHGVYVIKDIKVGDYFWENHYFQYKG